MGTIITRKQGNNTYWGMQLTPMTPIYCGLSHRSGSQDSGLSDPTRNGKAGPLSVVTGAGSTIIACWTRR